MPSSLQPPAPAATRPLLMAQLAEILAKMAEESMLEQQEVTLLQGAQAPRPRCLTLNWMPLMAASIRAGHARVIGLMELVGDDTALEEETLTAIRDEAGALRLLLAGCTVQSGSPVVAQPPLPLPTSCK